MQAYVKVVYDYVEHGPLASGHTPSAASLQTTLSLDPNEHPKSILITRNSSACAMYRRRGNNVSFAHMHISSRVVKPQPNHDVMAPLKGFSSTRPFGIDHYAQVPAFYKYDTSQQLSSNY